MKVDELMSSWVSSSKLALEPAREFGEIAKRAYAKTGEQNLTAIKEYAEFGLRGMKRLSEVRDASALINQQLLLAKEASEMMLANAEAYAKLANETQEDVATWAEKATSVAIATADEAVEKAA